MVSSWFLDPAARFINNVTTNHRRSSMVKELSHDYDLSEDSFLNVALDPPLSFDL